MDANIVLAILPKGWLIALVGWNVMKMTEHPANVSPSISKPPWQTVTPRETVMLIRSLKGGWVRQTWSRWATARLHNVHKNVLVWMNLFFCKTSHMRKFPIHNIKLKIIYTGHILLICSQCIKLWYDSLVLAQSWSHFINSFPSQIVGTFYEFVPFLSCIVHMIF